MRLRETFANIGSFTLIAFIVVSITAVATPAVGQDAPNGATVFKSKCITCHGADGSGTAVGKSLKVADLRSDEVQKKPDAEFIRPFPMERQHAGLQRQYHGREIQAAITYVRTLAPKKKK